VSECSVVSQCSALCVDRQVNNLPTGNGAAVAPSVHELQLSSTRQVCSVVWSRRWQCLWSELGSD